MNQLSLVIPSEYLLMIGPGVLIIFFFKVFSWQTQPYKGSVLLAYVMITTAYLTVIASVLQLEKVIPDSLKWLEWPVLIWGIPSIIGIFSGLAVRQEWVRNLAMRFRLYLEHPTPTAWDHLMGHRKEKHLNGEITLKNGTILEPVMLDGHFASSTSQRDLYVKSIANREVCYYIAEGEISTIKVTPFQKGK